ncbi:MAG TPA: GntR family transcriptional regulator [Hyphomicrobiales bacterium]|nr:GntR family transcriptional regulator [Hyphomicrobiales bacterium]
MSSFGGSSNPSGSAATRVYEDLRRRIISLGLPPDSTLSRVELADAYGVSQTPVREAMQRLEQDGLVRIYPQSKTVVSRINTQELHENQFHRVALETEVVRRLAEQRDEAVVKRAKMIIKMQESALEDISQIQVFNDLDREFHRTLFNGVGMQTLHQMISSKLGHLARCQRLELPRIGKMEDILEGHRAIIDGIEKGDPERSVEAMRKHLTGTILSIASLREEYPDYFV